MLVSRCCLRPLFGRAISSLAAGKLRRQLALNCSVSNNRLLINQKRLSLMQLRASSDHNEEQFDLRQPTDKDISSIAADDRTFEELTVDSFSELIETEQDRTLIAELLELYEYQKYVTYRVPTTIKPKQMREMMEMKRQQKPSQLNNYFNYMFKTEMAKINQRRVLEAKKEEARQRRQTRFTVKSNEPPGVLFHEDNTPFYGPWHNTCLTWQTEQDMRYPYNVTRMKSAVDGPRLVFDFDYEEQMARRDIVNMGEQIAFAYGSNYRNPEPFDMYFCNYKRGSLTDDAVKLAFGGSIDLPDMFITTTDRPYTELFPKERLVYLTPNANESLDKFNDEDVYIIGSIVDRSIRSNVTLAKAKREKLRMAKLPIDEHVVWGQSSKILTLNQIVCILLEVKSNGSDWKEAFFKHIPRRKLKTPEQIAAEEEIRLQKLTFKKKNMFKIQSNSAKSKLGSSVSSGLFTTTASERDGRSRLVDHKGAQRDKYGQRNSNGRRMSLNSRLHDER